MDKFLYALRAEDRWKTTIINIADTLNSIRNEDRYTIHSSTIKLWLSTFPDRKVVCHDLLSLDKLIEAQIQPSRVVLISELCLNFDFAVHPWRPV